MGPTPLIIPLTKVITISRSNGLERAFFEGRPLHMDGGVIKPHRSYCLIASLPASEMIQRRTP
jgi:hypothetical protein